MLSSTPLLARDEKACPEVVQNCNNNTGEIGEVIRQKKLCIIGDGIAAVAALNQARTMLEANPTQRVNDITVIAPGEFGGSVAYQPEQLPVLLNNDSQSASVFNEQFQCWALTLPEEQKNIALQCFAPRAWVGRFFRDFATKNIEAIQRLGVPVMTKKGHATGIQYQASRDEFHCRVSTGDTVAATHVLLAIGGMRLLDRYPDLHKLNIRNNAAYMTGDALAQRIAIAVPEDYSGEVVVLGSRLTAIDAFNVLQTINKNDQRKIILLSRSGILPIVRPSSRNPIDHSLAVLKRGAGSITFDEVSARVNHDLNVLLAEALGENVGRNILKNPLLVFGENLDAGDILKTQLENVDNEHCAHNRVHRYCRELSLLIDGCYHRFSDSDKVQLEKAYGQLFSVFGGVMPPSSGQRLLESIQQGTLSILSGVDRCQVNEGADGQVCADFYDREGQKIASSPYVVNATGYENIVRRSTVLDEPRTPFTTLLAQLYHEGLIVISEEAGGVVLDAETQSCKTSLNTGTCKLYAAGELTKGSSQFFSNGISFVARAAQHSIEQAYRH